MTQDVFNMLLVNSPFFCIFIYYAKKIGDICERLAKLEGKVEEFHRNFQK